MRDVSSILGRKPRGRHPDKRLTAVRVRSASPGRYADGNGLYLVVDPSGARRWVLRTVVKGKRCDLGLGGLLLVSLAEAREEATRLRRMARKGGDPLAERRQARRAVPTFKDAAKKVHEAHAATFRNAKHKAQWLASLEADIFPVLGQRPVDAIESADVLKALAPIWTTKPETARRLKQRIKVVLDWAKASGYRSGENPVDGVTKVLPKTRQVVAHHAALPYGKVSTFLKTLRTSEAGEATKLAFEFLILTATRTSEVLGARWEEIDQDAKTWTIPATRIKAGRAHRVPLSPQCLKILEGAEALTDGGPYVFPGRSPKTPLSNMAFFMFLRRLERDDITAHGFRSSFRDWAAERTNVPRAVCEAALAHVVKDKAEASYFRSDLFDRRRELMDTWAAFATAKLADIVPIRA
ncbi:MAG: integrase arm-type DNA-binding domain-containing protein [Acidobacteria bacterium]|nr:integrase arm-type DNA-binding domain-containing protein [Acidobacteriota bacterium]